MGLKVLKLFKPEKVFVQNYRDSQFLTDRSTSFIISYLERFFYGKERIVESLKILNSIFRFLPKVIRIYPYAEIFNRIILQQIDFLTIRFKLSCNLHFKIGETQRHELLHLFLKGTHTFCSKYCRVLK